MNVYSDVTYSVVYMGTYGDKKDTTSKDSHLSDIVSYTRKI